MKERSWSSGRGLAQCSGARPAGQATASLESLSISSLTHACSRGWGQAEPKKENGGRAWRGYLSQLTQVPKDFRQEEWLSLVSLCLARQREES